MKKAFEIKSHRYHLGEGSYEYAPIPRNAKIIYKQLAAHSIDCIGMRQQSDECWVIRLKGKKKNIQAFVRAADGVSFLCSTYVKYLMASGYEELAKNHLSIPVFKVCKGEKIYYES